MLESFGQLNPIMQAFIAGLFTWGCTIVGASFVFFFKSVNRKVLDVMSGFAAGVMIAASFWSLLAHPFPMPKRAATVACHGFRRRSVFCWVACSCA